MDFLRKKKSLRLAAVVLASLLAALNINIFVQAGGLFPGGVTGLSVLVQRLLAQRAGITVPYSPINILLNAVPVYIGFRYVGKRFTLYSLLTIVLTAVFVDVLPSFTLTYDLLLISVFGGIMNGIIASIVLSADTTQGGLDLVAIYLAQRWKKDTWNVVFAFNVVLLATAGLLFGWDKALYSIIYQFVTKQVVQLLYTHYQQQTMMIVTTHPKEISQLIYALSRHGATILSGEGSYEGDERSVVYSVVAADEAGRITQEVKKTDPKAFINVLRGSSVQGRFYIRPRD